MYMFARCGLDVDYAEFVTHKGLAWSASRDLLTVAQNKRLPDHFASCLYVDASPLPFTVSMLHEPPGRDQLVFDLQRRRDI